MENDSLVAAGVGMIINSVSEEHRAIVRDLLTGPEEIACTVARAYEDRHMVEIPEWAVPDRIMSYAGFNLYRAELHKDVRKDWDSQQIIRNQYKAHHAQQLRAAVEAERAAMNITTL